MYPLCFLCSAFGAGGAGQCCLYSSWRAVYNVRGLLASWWVDSRTTDYRHGYVWSPADQFDSVFWVQLPSIDEKWFDSLTECFFTGTRAKDMFAISPGLMASTCQTSAPYAQKMRCMRRGLSLHRDSSVLPKMSRKSCQWYPSGITICEASFTTFGLSSVASRWFIRAPALVEIIQKKISIILRL